MAHQFGTAVRNARANAIETTIGTAPILRIYDLTGGAPANTAASITATTLAEIELPSNWLSDASSGAKSLAGTWEDVGVAAGTADFFRFYDNGASVCHWQGSVTATGGGGDMTLSNTSIAVGQTITITSCTLTEGGA